MPAFLALSQDQGPLIIMAISPLPNPASMAE